MGVIMENSAKLLKNFIEKNYIDNPEIGSPDLSTGIRDLLTDLLHIGNPEGISINYCLEDAKEVYMEELYEEG
jgi:hypothetical protein